MSPEPPGSQAYDSLYSAFDSPLMQQARREAYGEDIGQHSWVTAGELRADLARLALGEASRLLDVGCGPCGPLVYAVRSTCCTATGVDVSAPALVSGQARAREAGVLERVTVREADLDRSLPFAAHSFDAVISLDVVLHVHDRGALFGELSRVLAPGGRLLFTDAGVITGALSNDEIRARAAHGYTQFVRPGYNELRLAAAGFRIVEAEDRTPSLLANARGRLAALDAHHADFAALQGEEELAKQRTYLETVVALSARGALSRFMFFAERTVA
jgi:cyclopropane fatty-acyl-phospholipid synthase-like methyltransferase